MIERILAFLGGQGAPGLPEADAQHLLGALMVRVARADGAYVLAEIKTMDSLLAATFALDALRAAQLRADCERLEQALPDTAAMAAQIRTTIAPEDRAALLDALRRVARADGRQHPQELAVIAAVTGIVDAHQAGPDIANCRLPNQAG